MPTPAERIVAQALYLQELQVSAKAIYTAKKDINPFPLPIDPQGRVILETRLNDEAWTRIYKKIKNPEADVAISPEMLSAFKKDFAIQLGHPITPTTSVSFDLQGKQTEDLHQRLSSGLKTHLSFKDKDDKTPEAILKAYTGLAKGRIISLQQETHFHAHLIGRMVNKAAANENPEVRTAREKIFGNTDEQFQKGVDKALLSLNDEVLKLQAKALEKAYATANKKQPFDEQVFALALNEKLDEARKELLPLIAKKVREEVIKSTGIKFTQDITSHLSKHLAEATSGSANDFMHIDKGTGFISFIGANEHTSHHQEFGNSFVADRIMYSHHLNEDEEVVPLSDRQQVRIPSIAVKKVHSMTKELFAQEEGELLVSKADGVVQNRLELLDKHKHLSKDEKIQIIAEYQRINNILLNSHGHIPTTGKIVKKAINQAILADTTDKIQYLQDKYKLGGQDRVDVGQRGGLPKAFVYNLYTTLNVGITGAIDERSNKQTQSAEHILEAAHNYNRANPDKPLCLVQNMAVNGWGHKLSLNEKNPAVVNEAALMVQMASLHTIYDSIENHEDKAKVEKLFNHYKDFLETKKSSFYEHLVSLEPLDKKAKKEPSPLDDLNALKNMPIKTSENTLAIGGLEAHRSAFTTNTKKALASLFKEDAFGQQENGYTYQALSVFAEQASMGGCKSANERAQAVNGRVAILDFVSLDKATREKLLDDYLSPEQAARLKLEADALETHISNGNTAGITQHLDNLYESLNLEGFQAVVSFIDQGGHAKLGTKGGVPNTNNSETVQTHVENASKWQCHKGLTKNVLKEFAVHEEVSFKKEFSNAAKKMGLAAMGSAIAGAGALGIAGIVLAAGVSFAFPPVGIAIAVAAAVTAAAASLFALGNFAVKTWKNHKAEVKFEKALKENASLIETGAEQKRIEAEALKEKEHAQPVIEQRKRADSQPEPLRPFRNQPQAEPRARSLSLVSSNSEKDVTNPLRETMGDLRSHVKDPEKTVELSTSVENEDNPGLSATVRD